RQDLLSILIDFKLSQSSISTIVKNHLSGKRFFKYDVKKEYSFCEEDQLNFLTQITELREISDKLKEDLHQKVIFNTASLKERSQKGNQKRYVLNRIDDPEDFLLYIHSKRGSRYIADTYAEFLGGCDELEKSEEEAKAIITD